MKGMHLTAIGHGKVLLEPTEGLDPGDPDAYLLDLAEHLKTLHAGKLLYDLGSVPVIDGVYYEWLLKLNAMCTISGVELVAVNMNPAAAFALANTLKENPPFACALDVDSVR